MDRCSRGGFGRTLRVSERREDRDRRAPLPFQTGRQVLGALRRPHALRGVQARDGAGGPLLQDEVGPEGSRLLLPCREGNRRKETCSNNSSIRSDKAHPAVWDLISDLLSNPERLRMGLNTMIEEQRKALRGDPEREVKVWLEKLAALDRKRSGYLDLAAEGILEREELRAKLAELQEAR